MNPPPSPRAPEPLACCRQHIEPERLTHWIDPSETHEPHDRDAAHVAPPLPRLQANRSRAHPSRAQNPGPRPHEAPLLPEPEPPAELPSPPPTSSHAAARSGCQLIARSHPQPHAPSTHAPNTHRRGWRGRSVDSREHGGTFPWARDEPATTPSASQRQHAPNTCTETSRMHPRQPQRIRVTPELAVHERQRRPDHCLRRVPRWQCQQQTTQRPERPRKIIGAQMRERLVVQGAERSRLSLCAHVSQTRDTSSSDTKKVSR